MSRDPKAVVDKRLHVDGMHGLGIAGASVMVSMIFGNPNAPCMTIGETRADMILLEMSHTGSLRREHP
jgi:choline dehydrogenase-like flavoprotein